MLTASPPLFADTAMWASTSGGTDSSLDRILMGLLWLQTQVLTLLSTGLASGQYDYRPCAARSLGKNQVVCVCNRTYCDNVEPVGDLRPGQAVLYYSNDAGRRLEKSSLKPTANKTSEE
ncbi:hypothetical protein ANCCEY_06661 [Ancylostoma ceylanicum]|uniref:Glucosylceramidase n=1 Tax=Ancylostoma ceylanicum TaxID=53326 RepID=A0A0D6M2U9_9BILA|nr:hypothetical protein ANCCEY_06661 [Ancylostoma ceylanicum]